MTPHRQLIKHDPEKGLFGDCTRTCVASLLDMKPEDVPHFGAVFAEDSSDEATARYWVAIESFLESKGFYLANFPFLCSLPEFFETMQVQNPNLFYMMGCRSPRGPHHVVCRGGEVVSDPNGYAAADLQPGVDGIIWVNVLVPIAMRAI